MRAVAVGEAYGRVADVYIDLFASGEHEHPDDVDMIARHLAGVDGVFIDVGCGPGQLTRLLGCGGASVLGFDLVPAFLEHARDPASAATFHVASMDALPLRDGSVAGLLCWYSLIHYEPDAMDEVLVELRRVLRYGGSLVIGFFAGEAVDSFDHKVTRAFRWPMTELVRRLRRAGFVEVERLSRGAQGDRRPHGVLVVRAV